jgi:hypothetical protein
LISVAGYVALIAGYYVTEFSQAKTFCNRLPGDAFVLPETFQVIIALSFGLAGIGALLVYANEVGGFEIMVKAVGFFRNQTEAYSDFGFLIKVAPFTCISSYGFWGLFAASTDKARKGLYCIGFVLTFILSLLILYSLGGRVQFSFYLLTFILYASFRRGKLPLPHVFLASLLFVSIVLFGKEITNLNVYVSDDLVEAAWEEVSTDPLSGIRKILLEFSFPFINLANIMEFVPETMGYRWFVDIPLGIAYLLPKPLLGLTLPPTVIMVYDEYVDVPMPIDLLSFGYLSMGVIGTIVVYMCFGFVLYLADLYLPPHGDRTMILFRAAWLLYLSQQVMYGSPHHALVAGFPLLVGTFAVVVSAKMMHLKAISESPPRFCSTSQSMGSALIIHKE